MSQLIEKPELAAELREYLEQQAQKGHEWVVYDTDHPISSYRDLYCFPDEEEALNMERETQQIFNWHMAFPISDLLAELKELERTQKEGLAVNVFEFSDLKDVLTEAGYPGHWVDFLMRERIPYRATDFSVRELVEYKGEQLLIELDFDLTTGRIRLDKLTAHLLNGPASSDQIPDMTPRSLLTVWQAESTTYTELVPLFIIGDTLIAARELSREHPDLALKELNTKIMNLNNLEDLKDELKDLRFPKKIAEEMERHMEKNLPQFQLRHSQPGDKGQVDMVLHFRQSAQSDYYYFNKYTVTLNNAKPLAEGHHYMVISPGDKGKPMFRKFTSPREAITYFKEQKGSSELAVGKIDGKELAFKTTLATKENEKEKENFIARDFAKVYKAPIITQTVYVKNGHGFTAEQSANLLQKRAVYRDDMLNVSGQPYKAWIMLDFEKPKDRFGNYRPKQYNDPAYGFDLQKTLDRYQIKELADPARREKLEESVRNGNRPLITTVKNGEEVKLRITVLPRYGELDFHAENGATEKREQFMTPKAIQELATKNANKEKVLEEDIAIGR